MMRRLLRALGAVAWLVALGAACVGVAYVSFNLVIRRGAVATPDVSGMPLREASAILADLGLRSHHDPAADRPAPSVAAGAVIEQRPQPGARVKRGGRIELIVSTGDASTLVPDLVGSELQAALVALSTIGLEGGATWRVESDSQPVGRIVETIPPAGSPTAGGSSIALVVSEGARAQTYVMPDLITRNYESTRAALERGGFRFGRITFERYEGIAPGTVLRQFPLAGHPLTRSDAISLAVAADLGGEVM